MQDRSFGRPQGLAPVRVGEELDVRIEAVGEKGDGVCKKKGFVLFVPNVKEGDEVRIRVSKVLRKVGFADVIGEPQGPIEKDTPPPPRKDFSSEARDMMRDEPVRNVEDTDDFGEELVEEPAEEVPAEEEPAEEVPAVEEPAEEEPAEEVPAVEEPAVEEPAVEEPAEEVPAVEEPAEEEKKD